MPNPPHNFRTLRRRNVDHRASILTIGAGMSHDIAPFPHELFVEKRASAETKLGFVTPVHANDTLYTWAEQVVARLKQDNHPNPKLALAQALDIPSEPCWRGSIAPLRNTPRHRVIARFAREELWEQIWSFNWDCVQESALQNVGIKRDEPPSGLPWPAGFRTIITAADCASLAVENTVKIVKPHGCVEALDRADGAMRDGFLPLSVDLADRFRITASELANPGPLTAVQGVIFAAICLELSTRPLVVAGWSASEQYLLKHIDLTVRPVLEERPLAPDELSIIDIAFNNLGHARLTEFYGKIPADVHIPIAGGFTIDHLFLWLQALYAFDCLRPHATDVDRPVIDDLLVEIDQPPANSPFVIGWADNFLPVWVRLCWRCGIMACLNTSDEPIQPEDIPLETGRDEHVPWHVQNIPRPDLRAAARLLVSLQNSGHAEDWDFDMFPGGLYRDNLLVIPLPAWKNSTLNVLRGLKALIDAIKQNGHGYLNRVAILLLTAEPDDTVSPDARLELKEALAHLLPSTHLAQSGNIQEIQLVDL
jgi:hypothetical protein